MRLGLRASIAVTVVLMTVAASSAVAVVSYQVQSGPAWDRFTASALAGFRSDVQQAAKHVSEPGASKVDRIADYMSGRLGVAWALVELPSSPGPPFPGPPSSGGGRYRAVAGSPGHPEDLRVAEIDISRLGSDPITYSSSDGSRAWHAVAGMVSPRIVLVEFYSRDKIDRELAMLRFQLIAVAAAVSLVAVVLGVLAARLVQRPVRAAAAAARRFGGGELDVRVPVRGRDELADLAGSFNTMAARLGESIAALRAKDRQQRRFIADVAHDLRTPLASVLAAAESLTSADPADRDRSADLVAAQARRLSALVEDLLEMSRFDAGAADYRPETVDLAALAGDAAEMTAPGRAVRVAVTGDPVIVGDPRRLHTVVRNLVSNAVRHGAPPIAVAIDGRARHRVSLSVSDGGPGIPDDLAPVVFDRFTRGDRARTDAGGSGLGLAIARENAALHGGRLEAAGGSTFVLTLPRGEPDHPEPGGG